MKHIKVFRSISFTINRLIWNIRSNFLCLHSFKAISCIEFDSSFRNRNRTKIRKNGKKANQCEGNQIRWGEYRIDVYTVRILGDKRGNDAKDDISCNEWKCCRYVMRYGRCTQRSRQVLSRTTMYLHLQPLLYSKHTWYNSDSLQGSEDSKCPESGKVA